MHTPPAPRRLLAAAALGALASLGLAVPGSGSAALQATALQVSGRPAFERVVVRFDGGRLSGLARQVDAPDADVADGRAVVRVNGSGIHAGVKPLSRRGVDVRVRTRPGSILVFASAVPERYKFVQYAVTGDRRRLVITLWRTTTSPLARVLDDRCLRLTGWRGGARPRARGLELSPLFEHGLVLSLRRAGQGSTTLAERPLIAREGSFLPDFSGYAVPGRWAGTLTVPGGPPVRAMLEAWSTSAKDGSLDCLVQTPVVVG